MPTTTNYSWTTPADTDLVKDGASAIRTLGSSADTTVKNLNPETTLGDIAYRSSTSNVNTRLGIGSAGQVLTVASGVPSWATPTSGSMTQIATGNFTSGTSLTISSISQNYKDLRLQIYGLELASGYSQGVFITLNSVATDYSTIVNGVYNGVANTYANGSATKIDTAMWIEASNPNAALDFTLKNYAQSTNRVICDWSLSNTGSAGNPTLTARGTGVFTVVAAQAITSITIKYNTATGGNYSAGNYILYGVN